MMDPLFLSILESSRENNDDIFSRQTYSWWTDFVTDCFVALDTIESVENRVNEFNGEMVRDPGHLLWLGIQFKTEKDKLLFMLKHVK